MCQHVHHRVSRARADASRSLGLDHVPRLRQKVPGKGDVDDAQRRGGESRSTASPMARKGSERRAYRDASVRRRRQPTESLCSILRRERVGDIRLNHTHRAAASALHEPRQKEQPECVRIGEYDIRDRRCR